MKPEKEAATLDPNSANVNVVVAEAVSILKDAGHVAVTVWSMIEVLGLLESAGLDEVLVDGSLSDLYVGNGSGACESAMGRRDAGGA